MQHPFDLLPVQPHLKSGYATTMNGVPIQMERGAWPYDLRPTGPSGTGGNAKFDEEIQ
jgi:hypothetical protein